MEKPIVKKLVREYRIEMERLSDYIRREGKIFSDEIIVDKPSVPREKKWYVDE